MYRALRKPPFRAVELQARDALIVRTVDRYRLATTDQLARVTSAKNRRALNRRLSQLWAADILDRPEIQIEKFAFAEKRPLLHALGQRGADWMASKYGVVYPKGKGWRTANQLKSLIFIDHTIGTTDAMLHFEEGLEDSDRYRFVDHHELLLGAPSGTTRRRNPFTLPTELPDRRGNLTPKGTKPDYTFAIEDRQPTNSHDPTRALLFLEWDNGTEDYTRSDPLQSSIAGKYLGYGDAYRRKLHTRLFGFKNFRVLFVVSTGHERVERMIATYQKVASQIIPGGAFLHTTVGELRMYGPYQPIWINGRGEQAELLR